jgi:hypothetical protein
MALCSSEMAERVDTALGDVACPFATNPEHDNTDTAAPSAISSLSLLDIYYSRVGEARNIRREMRTLQAVQDRLRSMQGDSGSEDSVVTQIRDAANRLTKANEDMDSLKQRCLELGVYESPSYSSESDYIESFSELGLDPPSRDFSPAPTHPVAADVPFSRKDQAYSDNGSQKQHEKTTMTRQEEKNASVYLGDVNSPVYINEANGPIYITKANSAVHINAGNEPIHINSRMDFMQMNGRNPSEEYNNSPSLALETEYEQMKLLLDKGVDPNVAGKEYSNALQEASAIGHKQIVRLLLEAGADVNAEGGGLYGSALQAASARGHEQVVRLLLDHGADVNAQGGEHYSSTLQAALTGLHEQRARLRTSSNQYIHSSKSILVKPTASGFRTGLETTPRPFCAIPYRRDADFIGREMLLDQICGTLSAPASRIALVGLGGVG